MKTETTHCDLCKELMADYFKPYSLGITFKKEMVNSLIISKINEFDLCNGCVNIVYGKISACVDDLNKAGLKL